MENLQLIAQIAASYKKANKRDCFEAIRELCNHINIDDDKQSLALANLYSYFLPSSPKKPKTGAEWVYLAKGKKDMRAYLNYVWQQQNGDLVATDGHRMHLLSGGHYDASTAIDTAGAPIDGLGRFPDYSRIIPRKEDASAVTTLKNILAAPNAEISTDKHKRTTIEHNGTSLYVDSGYWSDAVSFMPDDAEVYMFNDNLLIQHDNKLAVIMCVRR